MKKLYLILSFLLTLLYSREIRAQAGCSLTVQSAIPEESRCKATGTITVTATGGTGNYNYRVVGPISTPYTSSSVITGLSAGTYTVMVQDVSSNCVAELQNIVVPGSYEDPRFSLEKTDVTCANGSDATITVTGLTGGRGPYTYKIVAPSPAGVGTTNNTGVFTGLPGGEYAIELKDSCGGIQTRRINVLPYDWWIENHSGSRTNCNNGAFQLRLRDSRGNANTSSSIFSNFKYGVVNGAGDTSWYNNYQFVHELGSRRSLRLVAKDGCGNVRFVNWTDTQIPTVANVVATSFQSCNSFTARITGQTNLNNPTYCLYNSSNVQIACNTTGQFSNIPVGTYRITVRDECFDTTITRNFVLTPPKLSMNPNVSINRTDCNAVTASVSGLVNFTNPRFCLKNSQNEELACNNNGVFTNLPAGSYCIEVKDGCYDTTIRRCFTVDALRPSVAANITVSDPQCDNVDVSIGGQTNLRNPQFCLYNAANQLVACNTTGNFNNIPYGNYCMRITNDPQCYDTTIQRCFTVAPIPPSVNAQLNVNRKCNAIDLSVGGAQNLRNPQYCLYNAANQLVACNTTGVFANIPYGQYCMEIRNDPTCYDTTIRRCINVQRLVPAIGSLQVSNRGCTGYRLTVSGVSNFTNPQYRLKTPGGQVIATNTNGVFNNVPYGNYCVEVQNDANCYDTTITRCITTLQNKPSAGNTRITNKTCSGFNVELQNVTNFTNPTYTLKNADNEVVGTSSNGRFSNVPYGSYCMEVRDNCYDTTIRRCFEVDPNVPTISLTAQPSCVFNMTNIRVNVSNGTLPYTVKAYTPDNTLAATVTSSNSTIWLNELPALPGNQQYRIELTDNCGGAVSRGVTPAISTFNSNLQVTAKCPSGANQDGSSELTVTVSSNLGLINPTIIRKNGAVVNIPYNTGSVAVYKWTDLAPATYVIQYNLPGSCNNKDYDTVVIGSYQYPQLDKSASYQCDNNSFSVGANVTGGAPPFMYEIIGSVPSTPSIVAPPQASPIFNINNGASYSLVRLRVVDYCGNATLNDVSVLPLQNTVITAQSDCYYTDVTLSVPAFANSTYEWYHKLSETDSVLVGTDREYMIPYLEPDAVGEYVAKVSVNNGCLVRLNYYTVTGNCGGVLSDGLKLTGKAIRKTNQLTWNHLASGDIIRYQVERMKPNSNEFQVIAEVGVTDTRANTQFSYTDDRLIAPQHQYRIKGFDKSGKVVYSNLVKLKQEVGNDLSIAIYPNPVKDQINVSFQVNQPGLYQFDLMNAAGQVIHQSRKAVGGPMVVTLLRHKTMIPGVYFLKVTNTVTGVETIEKLLFQ
ncbi:MAG TPA: T9SS type A sorting domain-containing protein [Flavihumibacter sp.]|jgi:hypothetical protein